MAVRATATVTFLGLKQGLFLGAAVDHCGELEFAGLELPAGLGAELPAPLERLVLNDLRRALPRRPRSAHKGSCGRLLLVGGGPGMSGAIRLAAEAALRVGAGLVYVATHRDSVASVLAGRPEIICQSVSSGSDLEHFLRMVDGVVVGPGLGQTRVGARALAGIVLRTDLPLVVDADALNLLAAEPAERRDWLLTPHPGEAARLLGDSTVESVQRDRVATARCACGAVSRDHCIERTEHARCRAASATRRSVSATAAIPAWRPAARAMCSPARSVRCSCRLGDLERAARAGVLLHALAGDEAAKDGERGTVAGDLLPHLRAWANPELIADARFGAAPSRRSPGVRAQRSTPRALGRSCIGLRGDLGSGKTTWVRAMLRGLGYQRARAVADLHAARAVRVR